VLENIL